ncbi:hypothetical protein LZ31DRAFT_97681 [Colletotrichum somersetense]|nr:hypothetical protein LZ31DRAFT_97681 [Colletotrichum somersetense]
MAIFWGLMSLQLSMGKTAFSVYILLNDAKEIPLPFLARSHGAILLIAKNMLLLVFGGPSMLSWLLCLFCFVLFCVL